MCMPKGSLTTTRQRLRNYHEIVLKLRQLKRELADEYRKCSPVPAVSHLQCSGGHAPYVGGSAVERCVVKQEETQADSRTNLLMRQIAKLEKEKQKIEAVIDLLPPEEKQLVTCKYIRNESYAWIETHVMSDVRKLPAVLHEAVSKVAFILYFCENTPRETKAVLLA